jgi:hypothetical protein
MGYTSHKDKSAHSTIVYLLFGPFPLIFVNLLLYLHNFPSISPFLPPHSFLPTRTLLRIEGKDMPKSKAKRQGKYIRLSTAYFFQSL